jgi:Fe-S cluster assembly protein SufD
MKQIDIKDSRTIIEDVTSGVFEKEYIVQKNVQFTLAVVAKTASDILIRIRLAEAGSYVHIVGFIVGDKNNTITLKTLQLHEAPDTTSNLLVKSVLSGSSFFSYDGAIEVVKKAQKTDAYQRNENLLLSEKARAESKPKLEILANDVRCTHGATTGMLPEDQLWYLATRGIGRESGEKLLVEGFFEHAVSGISDTISRENVRRLLWQTL